MKGDNVTRIAPRVGLQREYDNLLRQQLTGALATGEALQRQKPNAETVAKALLHVRQALAALQRGLGEMETTT